MAYRSVLNISVISRLLRPLNCRCEQEFILITNHLTLLLSNLNVRRSQRSICIIYLKNTVHKSFISNLKRNCKKCQQFILSVIFC